MIVVKWLVVVVLLLGLWVDLDVFWFDFIGIMLVVWVGFVWFYCY